MSSRLFGTISLFTIYLVQSQHHMIGHYGQSCTGGIDDPPPSVCNVVGQIATDNGLGKFECQQNFDCCPCQTIICGEPNGTPCDVFSCNGDSGCFGVRDIRIYGSKEDGATISCNGDESCNGTLITGTNIKEVGCTGDGACARSTFEFDCLSEEPCSIGCGGDASCAGTPKDAGLLTTKFTIGNTAGIECAAEGCQYGTFTLLSNIGGGGIMCTGENACIEAEISINNIEGIICGGMNACKDARFLVIDPQQDFSVECSALGSCVGLSLEIIVNNDVDFFKGIGCGSGSCVGATVSIFNNNNKYITVENLECESPNSCKNAQFDFDGGSGGIGFENCKCGESHTMACDGIIGIDSCLSGLEKIECSGSDSCLNLQQTVVNVANDFELICNDQRSCKAFWLMIILNNNGRNPINMIKGYKCAGNESCQNAIIQLNNQQIDGGGGGGGNDDNDHHHIIVTIDKIECEGIKSCENTKFILTKNININEIKCNGGLQACNNCVVENYAQNTITPCVDF